MTCYREGCREDAIDATVVCLAHLEVGDEDAYAMEYAVASILYYDHDEEFMSDPRFDGLCYVLKDAQAWKRYPWIEREMLIAGSCYDTTALPALAHEKAAEWLAYKDPMFQ